VKGLMMIILICTVPWRGVCDTIDVLFDEYFRLVPEHAMVICGFVALEDAGYVVIDGYAKSERSWREGWFVIEDMRPARTVPVRLECDGRDTTAVFLNAYIEDLRYGQVVCRPARGGRILKAGRVLRRLVKALGYTRCQ
jgi:hypothetical protein